MFGYLSLIAHGARPRRSRPNLADSELAVVTLLLSPKVQDVPSIPMSCFSAVRRKVSMKNTGWVYGITLVIALPLSGCGGGLGVPRDSSVDYRGADFANADLGTGGASVLDSGVAPVTPDSRLDVTAGGQDSVADSAASGGGSGDTAGTDGRVGAGDAPGTGGGPGAGGATGTGGGPGAGGATGMGGATGTGGGPGAGGATGMGGATRTDGGPVIATDSGAVDAPATESGMEASAGDVKTLDTTVEGGLASAGSSIDDYLGLWVPDDSGWDDIAVIDIVKKNSTQLGVHAYGACSEYYCDWGEATVNFIGSPVVPTFSNGESFPITMNSPTSLHAVQSDGPMDYHLLDVGTGSSAGGTLMTLASGRIGSGFIAVDGTAVYRTHADGTVVKVPIAGGTVTTLASGQAGPGAIAVDGTNVYWVNNGTVAYSDYEGTVVKVPISGGAVTKLVSGQGYPIGIAVDGTSVYWSSSYDGTVMKVPIGGGTLTKLASGQNSPGTIAVDSANVYWTTYDGAVLKAPIGGGGTVTTLATGRNGPASIVVDSTSVYWANYLRGTVMKVAIGGGDVTTLASGQNGPTGIAVDGTSVYWTNAGTSANYYTDGTVAKVPIGGGTLTILAMGQGDPEAIAVDATSVYWTNFYGTLMQLTPK